MPNQPIPDRILSETMPTTSDTGPMRSGSYLRTQ